MSKKICVVTSGRWDYGYLYPVMKELEESVFDLIIAMPATHHNYFDIANSFKKATIERLTDVYDVSCYGDFFDDCRHVFRQRRPDVVIVLGDRFEIHAAATAALLCNIPIAHIHGGETTLGSFDNELRNSITMMSKYHFCATRDYAHNVVRMVTPNDCEVFRPGSPGIDYMKQVPILSAEELRKRFPLDFEKPFIIASFHPVTKEQENTQKYIDNFLSAICDSGEQAIIIEPNADPSNDIIRNAIYDALYVLGNRTNKLFVYENIQHNEFLSLMHRARMMVGNSSAGIIEAAYANLPVVNIGTRQNGRTKPINVFDCGYSRDEILETMFLVKDMKKKYDSGEVKIDKLYGEGDAAVTIVEILEDYLHLEAWYG